MSNALARQRVVVIGGSSGIGHAVARLALAEGAQVFIGSSDAVKVQSAVDRLGGNVAGWAVDVRDEGSLAGFFDRVGAFDHLVYTAGDWGAARAPLLLSEMTPESAAPVFDIRFWGAIRTMKQARRHIREGGSFTITDGMIAHRPRSGAAMNTAMAGATEHLTRALAVELMPLRVNAVCPGYVLTEEWDARAVERNERIQPLVGKQPLPRGGDAREVAEAYLYLMRATFTTGQVLVVDGGLSLT